MPTLTKPTPRRATRCLRAYAFEVAAVSAGADNTGTALGITNLSREQQRRARQKEEERRRRERLQAVEAEHRDARLDVYATMMTAATAAAISGNPAAVGLVGGATFLGSAASRCSGTSCHLTRK